MPPFPQDQQFYSQFPGPDGMHHFAGGPGGFVMMMLMLLLVVTLGTLLASPWRARHVPAGPAGRFAAAPSRDTALGVLEERFARSEIDTEEFKTRRELLVSRA